jgi:DNA-binding CsgD family transcriptional regulator
VFAVVAYAPSHRHRETRIAAVGRGDVSAGSADGGSRGDRRQPDRFDAKAAGDLIVTVEGLIQFCGPEAFVVLERQDALRRRQHRLEAIRPTAQAALQAALARVGAGTADELLLRLDRLGSDKDYILKLRAMPTDREPGLVQILLVDPDADLTDLSRFAAHVFHLSDMEARVCELLISGLSTAAIGDLLDLKATTVRTYLSETYAKTGTRTQADLIRRLLLLKRLI